MLESLALCSIIAIGLKFVWDMIKGIYFCYRRYKTLRIARKMYQDLLVIMNTYKPKSVKETKNGTKKNTRKSKKS